MHPITPVVMHLNAKKILTFMLAALTTYGSLQASETSGNIESVNYRPNIHGTLRPRYELLTDSGESRFQVRNARLTIDGRIAPQIDYFAQVDLCAKGSFMPLDFWVRIGITKGLRLQAGQFRMPFGVDMFRAPHTYFFSNRAFMVRNMCNYRAVGIKGSFTLPSLPLTFEAGVFNPYAIGIHEVWCKNMNYSAKAVYNLPGVKIATGFMSICPDRVRANLVNACIGWFNDRWTVESEYTHEHYTRHGHKAAHGYTVFGVYRMPIKAGVFNRLSFEGRVDGITDHSTAYDVEGGLVTNNPGRNRITLGSTISYIRTANMFVDLRIDYEKFFYHRGITPPEGQNDKIVAEIVLRF